ncbi:MAG: hypothetical protein KBF54_02940 [Rhizobiales bacterium]|nr:hypothetical protein [Hyphomicrobiales bacterium]
MGGGTGGPNKQAAGGKALYGGGAQPEQESLVEGNHWRACVLRYLELIPGSAKPAGQETKDTP